jgi:16S rRNA (guanine527-N7)-methyltransferase
MGAPPPFPVSRETLGRLRIYEELLLKWSSKINLVSRETLGCLWGRHFWDSAQIAIHVQDKKDKIIDLGSGAGFPGLVLAAMGYSSVTLVEKDQKKSTFLKNAAVHMGVSVHVRPVRFEALAPCVYDVVISRACASLSDLLLISRSFTGAHTRCIFLKGQGWREEVSVARERFFFNLEAHPSVTCAEAMVLVLREVRGA